jgi:serine protease inhibitor
MFIILPPFAKSNGIEAVLKQLSVESLQEIVEDDLPRAVEVSIPKFTVEHSLELTPVSSFGSFLVVWWLPCLRFYPVFAG